MRICMLVHRSVEHDGRVRREMSALTDDGHDVLVLHLPTEGNLPDGPLEGGHVRSVVPPPRLHSRLPQPLFRALALLRFIRATVASRPDVVHAHDAAMLLPGAIGATISRASLVYDSHELATGVPYRERTWGLLVRAIERLIVPRCSAVLTVSEGIAERLHERYRLTRRPIVVRNLPDLDLIASRPASTDVRTAFGIGDAPLVLHQGSAASGRGAEALVPALALLPSRCRLLFLGVDPESPEGGAIRALAARASVADRVHLLAPAPLAELLAHTAQADVGISLLEDSCENHRLALPNKIFEYLAANLPVVVSDLPELRGLLASYSVGRTAKPSDRTSVAAAIKEVLDQPRTAWPGLEAAREELTWERESSQLLNAYLSLQPRARTDGPAEKEVPSPPPG